MTFKLTTLQKELAALVDRHTNIVSTEQSRPSNYLVASHCHFECKKDTQLRSILFAFNLYNLYNLAITIKRSEFVLIPLGV